MQGQKTQLLRLNTSASPNAYVQMAGLLSVEPQDATRGSVRTTTMDQSSTAETFEPATLRDFGGMNTVLEFDADGAAEVALKADYDTSDVNQRLPHSLSKWRHGRL